MSIKGGDRLPHRRISIYFNVKINQIITTKYKSTPFCKISSKSVGCYVKCGYAFSCDNLTGSDLMKCGDREREKGYNVLIKTELSGLKVRDPSCPKGKKLRKK